MAVRVSGGPPVEVSSNHVDEGRTAQTERRMFGCLRAYSSSAYTNRTFGVA
ncbi:hypothetical protein [Mycobacterium sp. AZCC_0083]|uniref:hypothetical protein n=1 Tax=Mycobacterium sp. AZCC_0083 TaxID=2735882 RepID=UPI001608809E|nr:hypothetical protein [Mycobacterium sp. AZCC_0083]MBB5167063.1 hypothetical protein [Mycobacterium sp. AZCC_0083]